jgi:hypothetical protein
MEKAWKEAQETQTRKKERDARLEREDKEFHGEEMGSEEVEVRLCEEETPQTWEERWTEDDEVMLFGLKIFESVDSVNVRKEVLRKLMVVLSKGGMEVKRKTPMDGNCFYHVAARFLKEPCQKVRQMAVDFLMSNLTDESWWKGVIGETEREARYYLREQRADSMWADHPTILGVAKAFGLEVQVWDASGDISVNGEGEV